MREFALVSVLLLVLSSLLQKSYSAFEEDLIVRPGLRNRCYKFDPHLEFQSPLQQRGCALESFQGCTHPRYCSQDRRRRYTQQRVHKQSVSVPQSPETRGLKGVDGFSFEDDIVGVPSVWIGVFVIFKVFFVFYSPVQNSCHV